MSNIRIYNGKPFYMPGKSPDEVKYNQALDKISVKNLGMFSCAGIYPINANRNSVKSGKSPEMSVQYTLYQVVNKGDYEFKNRPGERILPQIDGQKCLKSYVIIPCVCTNANAKLSNKYEYKSQYEDSYKPTTDPRAVELAAHGKGIIQDIAEGVVDDTLSYAKKTLKVSSNVTGSKDLFFNPFLCPNHFSTVISQALNRYMPDELVGAKGVLPKQNLVEELNPDVSPSSSIFVEEPKLSTFAPKPEPVPHTKTVELTNGVKVVVEDIPEDNNNLSLFFQEMF